MAVARQKLDNVQESGAVIRSENDDVTLFAVDELEPPKNERAQEDVTQLSVRRHDVEQFVALDLEHLTRHRGGNPAEKPPAGQDRPLSREHPGGEIDSGGRRELNGGVRERIQLTRQNNEDLGHWLARLAYHFPLGELTAVTVRLEPLELGGRQLGECLGLLSAGFSGRGNR